MKINVIADLNNMPTKPITKHGYLVARQDITTGHADLWYYGFYEDKDRANQAAVEIRNGVVLEVPKPVYHDGDCRICKHHDTEKCEWCGEGNNFEVKGDDVSSSENPNRSAHKIRKDGVRVPICSNCYMRLDERWNYCPNCGSQLEGEAE